MTCWIHSQNTHMSVPSNFTTSSSFIIASPGGSISTPCQKRSQVCGRESEWWPKYIQQRRQCWNWGEFEKQAVF